MTRAPDLRKPAAGVFRAYARKVLKSAAEDLNSALNGGSVHAARRSLKQLRSLLRLIRPAIGKAAARTADARLKAAADRLAGARRAEALKTAVLRLGLDAGLTERLQAAVTVHCGADRTPQKLADAIAGAVAEIAALRVDAGRWHLPKSGHRLYVEGVRACYARARRALRASLASRDAGQLHEARKWVIHNLHHMEQLRRLWPELMTVWASELTVLREALGDFNDLAELRVIAEPVLAGDEAAAAALGAALDRETGRLLARASCKAGLLYAEKPSAFARRISKIWDSAAE